MRQSGHPSGGLWTGRPTGAKKKDRKKGEEIMEEERSGNEVWTLADSVFIFSCRRPPTGADPRGARPSSPDGRGPARRAQSRPQQRLPSFPKGSGRRQNPPARFPKRCGNYNQGLRPGGRQLFKVSTGAPLGRLRDGANPSGGPSPGSPLGLRDRAESQLKEPYSTYETTSEAT